MFRAIEAIYENGRLKFLEKIGNIKRARVMVVFLDKKGEEGLNRGKITKLPPIKLPKESIEKYTKQFEEAEKKIESEDIKLLEDSFFSLEPIDIGYTNASMLDTIIANEGITIRG